MLLHGWTDKPVGDQRSAEEGVEGMRQDTARHGAAARAADTPVLLRFPWRLLWFQGVVLLSSGSVSVVAMVSGCCTSGSVSVVAMVSGCCTSGSVSVVAMVSGCCTSGSVSVIAMVSGCCTSGSVLLL